MYLTEQTRKKWDEVINHDSLPEITDHYRKSVTIQLLENQDASAKGTLQEAGPINHSHNLGDATNIKSYDPILISLVRRAAPNLVAFDIMGVQPMSGPTGLIFAMRSRYQTGSDKDLTDDPEALFNEALTAFSGAASDGDVGDVTGPASDLETDPTTEIDTPGSYTTGAGMTTQQGEDLGTAGSDAYNEMGYTIDKVQVAAKSRKLKGTYSMEHAEDLRAIHGLEAETEISNMLTQEISAELNREMVRRVYIDAKVGASGITAGTTANAGVFDLNVDSNGRWSVEKFKGLMFHLEREANAIAKETRRGKGNIILCSSDVASALSMAGKLDHNPALAAQTNLAVDDTGNTFAGVLNNQYKVYIDPYFLSASGANFVTVGYKGTNAWDAGIFYAPYIPLQMAKTVGEDDFHPRIGFRTRYGVVSNPFANSAGDGSLTANANVYYRKLKIINLM